MAARASASLIGVLAALALPGCAGVEDAGSYGLVLQDRYAYSTCKEIEGTRNANIAREKELVGLMEKADSGGLGGMLVGATTYQSELAQTRAHLKFLNQAARDKGCGAPATR